MVVGVGRNKGRSKNPTGRGVQRQETIEIKIKRNVHRTERDREIETEVERVSHSNSLRETKV